MRPLDVVFDRSTPLEFMGGVFLVLAGALLVLGGASGLAALELSSRLRRLPRGRKASWTVAMLALVLVGFAAAAFALMANRFGFAGASGGSG